MRFFYTCVFPYSFRRASLPPLLHLLQPRQPHARISIPLPKSYLFRQPLRLRILLSCLLDFALHLEELSKIVCRNCAAHIALFVALGRCDGGGLRERFCGPLVTGKSVGEADIVIALSEEAGDCCARQVEMLFTVLVSIECARGCARGKS
jgi:hypothetical protein